MQALKRKSLPKGYMGRVLYIDLTDEKCEIKPLDPELAALFFGGRGLGAAFLFRHFLELERTGKYKNAFSDVDPLSGDNVLVFSTSPATGTKMPTSGRIHMNYKSPLTGAYGSTNAGGRWSVDLKKTGYDMMVITGKAERPLYLVISDRGVEFVNAGPDAGLDAVETRTALKERYTKRTQALTIGAAGKNRSLFAAVMADSGKAFGRGGGGAVWGAKNLYAIAVIPGKDVEIEVADGQGFNPGNEKGAMYHARLKMDVGKFTKKEDEFGILPSMGSLGILGMVNHFNQLVHNNMKDTDHSPYDINRINGEALRYHEQNAKPGERKIKVRKSSCFNCPVSCKRESEILDGDNNIVEKGEGPEFESTALLGANLSIYDLTVITEANFLANRYGLDTISLGATIASFFELYSILSTGKDRLSAPEKKFMDDILDFTGEYGEPGFGKPELLIPIIHLVGTSTGIGRYLAEGSRRFCMRYGHEELSMSIKGLELPAYDPRASFSQALGYEMNNRGGCHLEGGYTAPHSYCAGYAEWPAGRIEGTPLISKNAALKNTALDVIGVCAYGGFSLGLDEYASLVNAVTGDKHDSGTLKNIARRVITLERLFNCLCGLTGDDDWLPDRFYKESVKTQDGTAACSREAFEKMHMEYYDSFGWDSAGRPGSETLRELKLLEFVGRS